MNGPEPTIVAPIVQSFAQFEVLWGYPAKGGQERRLKARSAVTQDMTAFTMQQMRGRNHNAAANVYPQSLIAARRPVNATSAAFRVVNHDLAEDCRGKGARSRSGGDALTACTQP
jgi:hypothetical protein